MNIVEKINIVETLRKEDLNSRKGNENKKIKIDFNSNASENVAKLIERSKINLSLAMQVLPAKEIENFLQRKFNLLDIKVSELEAETTKRLIGVFAPKRYSEKPSNDDTKTFLDDLLSMEDIIVSDEEKTSWGTKKVKVSLNEDSELFTKEKVYSVGNTPKGIKIDIGMNGKSLLKRPIFTIPGIKLTSCTKDLLYKNIAIGGKFNCLERYESKDYAPDNMYKVLDLNYLVSLCTILENCYMYIDQDTSFMYDVQNSFYGLEYTVEDFLSILNLKFLTEKNLVIPSKIEHMICESALAVTHIQMSAALYDRYIKETNSIYAKAFNTKKNIPDKIKAVMANNTFLETFSYIELDESVDIEKFYLIENEFEKIKDILKLDRFIKKDAELRFKKLGKHRENGLYFKEQNCICIDIDSPSSFIHELGHLIDNKMGLNESASVSSEFRLLAIKYIKELEKNSELLNEEKLKEYKRNRMNYHTPTEVFARTFEMYLSKSKRLITSFIPREEHMTVENGYPILTDELLYRIESYFSNIFEIAYSLDVTTSESQNSFIISNFETEEFLNEEENTTETLENQEEDTEEDNSIAVIEGENGVNFIFKIVEDARSNSQSVRYSSRRRRLNRRAVNEDSLASQITFF